MQKILITISNDIPLTPGQIARILETALGHLPAVEVTVTPGGSGYPSQIDIAKGKEWSDIALTGDVFKELEKIAKANDIPIEQVLRRGLDKMRAQVKNGKSNSRV